MNKLIFLFTLVSSHTNLTAQSDTIPFKLATFNNILVEVILNNEDTLDLMLHTAVNSISLTREASEKLHSKKEKNQTVVESWGGKSDADYTMNNILKIGNYEWDSLTIWTSERSGQFSDGKFGPNLFGGRKLELNFDENIIVVRENLPKNIGYYSKHHLEIENGSAYIQGLCINGNEIHTNRFMIHSGYGGTILLDDEFASKSKMNALQIISESELKDSYGNVLKKKKAILPEFKIADYGFTDLPMGFFEGKIGNQKESIIGGELLKRFNIILDLKEKAIYLRPNSLMNSTLEDI